MPNKNVFDLVNSKIKKTYMNTVEKQQLFLTNGQENDCVWSLNQKNLTTVVSELPLKSRHLLDMFEKHLEICTKCILFYVNTI